MTVSDRCSVPRKGKYIGTVEGKDTTRDELAEMMVGRKVSFAVEKGPSHPESEALTVRNLSVVSKHHGKKVVNNVSFSVHKGKSSALPVLAATNRASWYMPCQD